jgi:hypothetical protein
MQRGPRPEGAVEVMVSPEWRSIKAILGCFIAPKEGEEFSQGLTSSIVLVLVLVVDSLDCPASAIPTDVSSSCSRCFRLSKPITVKIENENDHENEHD